MTRDEFITGEKFCAAADFVFTPLKLDEYDYQPQANTFDESRLSGINVVYTHTMYKDLLFARIAPLSHRFIIVTHNSDYNIWGVRDLPPNVLHWFSQNVCAVDPRLSSLPIGLENNMWFPDTSKKDLMLAKIATPRSHRNLVYVNHDVSTNRSERTQPYDVLAGKPFATVARGFNPHGFETYLDDLYSHKFIVSPQGNGVDTHRKWEALYLGTIPVEKRCPNNTFYEDLPICFVDDWAELTEDFLTSEYERIRQATWNLEKLKMSYWTSLITSTKSMV